MRKPIFRISKRLVAFPADVYKKQDMCQFQQLYCDAQGYIIRCNECEHYQLLFNRTVLSLTENEFQAFLKIAESYRKDEEPATKLKDIVLPTPHKGVHLVLSNNQVAQLAHMLETADSECKALSLLHLFQ